jgi:hypothetical protein
MSNESTIKRICCVCHGEFYVGRKQGRAKYCPKPECQSRKIENWKRTFKKRSREYYREKQQAYKSYRKKMKAENKKEKRVCQGKGKITGCHGYIDNANRWWCSNCHSVVSRRLTDPDAVYFLETELLDLPLVPLHPYPDWGKF